MRCVLLLSLSSLGSRTHLLPLRFRRHSVIIDDTFLHRVGTSAAPKQHEIRNMHPSPALLWIWL